MVTALHHAPQNGAMVAVVYRKLRGLNSLAMPQELSPFYPSVRQAHLYVVAKLAQKGDLSQQIFPRLNRRFF